MSILRWLPPMTLLLAGCGDDTQSSWTPSATDAAAFDGSSSDGPTADASSDGVAPDASKDASQDAVAEDGPTPNACDAGPDDCFVRKYFLLIFNPVLESQGGKTLIKYKGWNDPDTLAAKYVEDVRTASHGSVSYVQGGRLEADAFPVKEDGFQYTDDTFLACLSDITKCHKPGMSDGVGYAIDYPAMLTTYDICAKLNAGEIDELWAFGAPFMGMWEANQAGTGAFFTNGPVVTGTSCNRILNIMGFSYERGIAEMLEDLGHRTEGTLNGVYGGGGDWQKFIKYDKTSPGAAQCGSIHWAPNSDADYDWGNTKSVTSFCDDWNTFPNLAGVSSTITCSAWSCDAAEHKRWWMRHLPHVPGSTQGKRNNWWAYVTTDKPY